MTQRVTVSKRQLCLHCMNPIMRGQEAVKIRRTVEGKRVWLYLHYPTCFEEVGGRLVHSKTGVAYRPCTPIWTRLGKDKAWHTELRKRVKALKRELRIA